MLVNVSNLSLLNHIDWSVVRKFYNNVSGFKNCRFPKRLSVQIFLFVVLCKSVFVFFLFILFFTGTVVNIVAWYWDRLGNVYLRRNDSISVIISLINVFGKC